MAVAAMSAALLRKATQAPEQLTHRERASLAPEDRNLITRLFNFHADRTDMELTRVQRIKRTGQAQPPVKLISDKRWAEILGKDRGGSLRFTELAEHEIWAMDNDPRLKAEFEGNI